MNESLCRPQECIMATNCVRNFSNDTGYCRDTFTENVRPCLRYKQVLLILQLEESG